MNFKSNEFLIRMVKLITTLLQGTLLAFIFLIVESNNQAQNDHALCKFAFEENTKALFWVVIIFISFGLGYFKFNIIWLRSTLSSIKILVKIFKHSIYDSPT